MSQPIQTSQTSHPAEREAFRFGLRTLLVVVAGIAALCGGMQAGGAGGFFLALAVVSFVVLIWSIAKRKPAVHTPAMLISIFSGLLALICPAVESAREAAQCNHCYNNLKLLGLALDNYHASNKSLPPVYTLDELGAPLQSWRLFLLPYAATTGLGAFQGFNWSEPWDSRGNLQQAQVMQPISHALYGCDTSAASSANTDYVAVTGPDTVWRAGLGVRFEEITDGPENTILLIEMKNSGIAWNEPRDFDAQKLPAAQKLSVFLKSLSNHRHGLHVLFCDGHVEMLPFTIPLDQFEALLTKSGGEMIERFRW
jgi:prepilin-type processing-associated H-X9-DG protein